jgi:hypothetical protein
VPKLFSDRQIPLRSPIGLCNDVLELGIKPRDQEGTNTGAEVRTATFLLASMITIIHNIGSAAG